MVEQLADNKTVDYHDSCVIIKKNSLINQGYDVYKVVKVKRPFLNLDVFFPGNVTDIYYRRTK
jgi:hypothetical protein